MSVVKGKVVGPFHATRHMCPPPKFSRPICSPWVIWSVLHQPPSVSQNVFPYTNFGLGGFRTPNPESQADVSVQSCLVQN